MIGKSVEAIRIRSEIERNLRECNRVFKITSRGGVKPSEILKDLMHNGSLYSFMIKEAGMTSTTGSNTVTFTMVYTLGRYTLRNMLLTAEKKASEVSKKLIRPEMSPLLKALILHNYLVDTVTYDHNSKVNPLRYYYAHSAYGALVEGKSVCQGIADAFALLLNSAGEECFSVYGEARETPASEWGGHAWNMIPVRGGAYAHIDTTFDICVKTVDQYMYFVKSSAQMRSDHQWEESIYPKASSSFDAKGELSKELALKRRSLLAGGVPEKYMRL